MSKTIAERAAMLRPLGLVPLLKQDELKAFYGVSDWMVDEWIKRGCPVEPTPFRGRRFDLEHVKAWVAETVETAA
jgi:phage terminase Nu1 subunit (DNA packaging protein)